MEWTIPGTTLTIRRDQADTVDTMFRTLFLAGGLTLSQVAGLTGLEPYAIQNWVKRGFLSPPQRKRYRMDQVCRIATINMLKSTLSLEKICSLIRYINGDLADTEDDLVDDAALYFMFVRLAARARHIGGEQNWEPALEEVTADYTPPFPEAKERLIRVLRVMFMAWIAGRFLLRVDDMVAQLET